MYEFSSAVALVAVTAFLVLVLRGQVERGLGAFVMLPVVLYLGLASSVLYTEAGPLVPALNSYWIKIHVAAAIMASGAFLLSGVVAVLYLIKTRYDDQLATGAPDAVPGHPRRAAARRARPRPGVVQRDRLRLPGLDLRGHRRCDLGRVGVGPLLGLGPEGDLVVHHLGALRRLPARPRDGRLEGPQGGVGSGRGRRAR